MNQILNHTQSYNFNWANSVNDYTFHKRNLEWGRNSKPPVITDRMIKENDKIFNPILQVYNDQNKEKSLRIREKQDLVDTIVKNQDYQLKMEQTFNVINLKDRLKGFETDPLYPIPKEKLNKRKNLNVNKVNYNILSNLPLSQHHYDKPENRPRTENSAPIKTRRNYINASGLRDYDIISTRYKQFHNEKTNIDKEINKIQTAKIFFKKNDYNPIKGTYFDESKEQDFIKKRDEQIKNWGKEYKRKLPSCAKGQSELYNLLNMEAVNEEELRKADQKEKNKKQRFDIKYKMENFYHDKSLREMDKKDYYRDQKYSYQRYKESDARQYDIIDLKDRPYKEHSKNVKKDNITDWDKLVMKAGDNNTFGSKEIYKDLYDFSENGINYDKFQNDRKKKLSNLPKIEQDNAFGGKVKLKPKLAAILNEKENTKINVRERMMNFDKEKFFKGNKNVFYKEDEVAKITHNIDMNRRGEAAEENKEKNMRNKAYTIKKENVEKI